MNSVSAPWRRLANIRRSQAQPPPHEDFWALRAVSFEAAPGEVIGIIGRNGAGKSTLLKILSHVVEPSGGRAELRGRLGSLLEVGTGFHPELTGRENIYLSGTILGMGRREIDRKFDEIVSFAGLDQFLDTPVKRYSSGMYVRLAFAVAAHLEPEILVVDEVLAVGDAAFQKKCLDKMRDVGRDGRTILFVSHNLAAVRALCDRGIVLQEGKVAADAAVGDALAYYLKSLETTASTNALDRTDRRGAGRVRLAGVEIDGGHGAGCLTMGNPARFTFRLNDFMPGLTCIFTVYDSSGQGITRFNNGLSSLDDTCDPSIGLAMVCMVDELLLAPGRYRIDVALHAGGELQDRVDAAAFFDVERGAVRGREVPRVQGDWKVCMPHRWESPR